MADAAELGWVSMHACRCGPQPTLTERMGPSDTFDTQPHVRPHECVLVLRSGRDRPEWAGVLSSLRSCSTEHKAHSGRPPPEPPHDPCSNTVPQIVRWGMHVNQKG